MNKGRPKLGDKKKKPFSITVSILPEVLDTIDQKAIRKEIAEYAKQLIEKQYKLRISKVRNNK